MVTALWTARLGEMKAHVMEVVRVAATEPLTAGVMGAEKARVMEAAMVAEFPA